MKRNDRFASLEEVKAEKHRLAALRDGHADRLQGHLASLQQQDFRRAMIRGVVADTWAGLMPNGLIGPLVGRGGIMRGLELAMGARGGWIKRAGLFLMGLAAPSLLGKIERIPMAGIGHELGISVERIKEYFRQYKAKRAGGTGS